jgi:hypothetical protein
MITLLKTSLVLFVLGHSKVFDAGEHPDRFQKQVSINPNP